MSALAQTRPATILRSLVPTKQRYYVFGLILMFMLVQTPLFLNGLEGRITSAIYVMLLWAICSSPLLFTRQYRGIVSIALIFMMFYFASFALQDLVTLFNPIHKKGPYPADIELTSNFMFIVGAIFFLLGYGLVAMLKARQDNPMTLREWQPRVIITMGLILWAGGYIVTTFYQFGVADRASGITIDSRIGGFLTLMRYFQPMGSLLLIYGYLKSSHKKLLFILLATFALDIALGYFGDSKEIALRGPLLLIISMLLLSDRIPKATLIIVLLVTGIGFNLFLGHRQALGITGKSRLEMLAETGAATHKIAANPGKDATALSQRLGAGLEYFSSRVGLKYAANVIHAKAGDRFLNGKTIEPLLYAFIPRFIMPDKPNNAMIGLLFSETFHLASKGTFVSMGQLTELYWNFGWAGVVMGMTLMGLFMGWLASRFRMDNYITLPRYLFLLTTIYVLVLRFETGIALAYTVWLRIMLVLLILNWIMPKVPLQRPKTGTARP